MRMPFELFVALRYLFSRRKQTFIYIISIMSILGVALGVGALVVVLGVYNGLTTDMRDKIIGANAHGIVMSYVPAAFQQHPDLVRRVEAVEHVRGATPFIYTEVMLSAAGGVKGLVLRGIDPESAPKVLSMLREIRRGSVADLKREGTPGIVIGEELAKRLGIGLGSRVNLLSPSGEKGATGYSPRIRPFEVVGIFKTGMFEYDATLAFVDLKAARDILGLPDGFLTGIEIMVDDVYKADVIAQSVQDTLGSPFYVRHWMEMNANLFAALKLEKIGMFILLTMVVLIGSFSIVTSLVMLVMEKTRDIAILMSMGATRSMIRRIFMLRVFIGPLSNSPIIHGFPRHPRAYRHQNPTRHKPSRGPAHPQGPSTAWVSGFAQRALRHARGHDAHVGAVGVVHVLTGVGGHDVLGAHADLHDVAHKVVGRGAGEPQLVVAAHGGAEVLAVDLVGDHGMVGHRVGQRHGDLRCRRAPRRSRCSRRPGRRRGRAGRSPGCP